MMKKKKYLVIIMSFLAIHLIYSNASLLIDLHKIIKDVSELTKMEYALRLVFAFSYSIITVLIIAIYPSKIILLFTSLFDGFAVYLKYNVNQNDFVLIASLYFGLYTMLIVIISGIVVSRGNANSENIDIDKLKKKEISLKRSLNALKDEEKKHQKQLELQAVQHQLMKITEQ